MAIEFGQRDEKSKLNFFLELVIIVLVAMLTMYLATNYVARTFLIPSSSMENTLSEGDRALTWKLGKVDRGDVIVFVSPQGWDFEGEFYIKRVIGLPGDVVETSPQGIVVNGKLLKEEYVKGKSDTIEFSITVPEDSYWVMGDNRENSSDSRYNTDTPSRGFVSKDAVEGIAVYELTGWERIK